MAVVDLVAGAGAGAGGEGDSPGATAIEIQISPPSLSPLFRSVTLLSSSFALPLPPCLLHSLPLIVASSRTSSSG